MKEIEISLHDLKFIRDGYKNLAENGADNMRAVGKGVDCKVECKTYKELYEHYTKSLGIAIKALELMQELIKRNITAEDIKNYAQFEDECIKKNFTFKSLLEAREKQIPEKPIDRCMFKECPNCGEIEIQYCNHCPNCGQKLDWSEEE